MPYYNGMYNMQQPNIDRINRQIEDLQNLKNQMQNPPQIPVQNFINSQPQTQVNANQNISANRLIKICGNGVATYLNYF